MIKHQPTVLISLSTSLFSKLTQYNGKQSFLWPNLIIIIMFYDAGLYIDAGHYIIITKDIHTFYPNYIS